MTSSRDGAVAGPGPSTSSRRSVSSSHALNSSGGGGGQALDLSTVAARLLDPAVDVKSKCGIVTEIREVLEFRTREADVTRNLNSLVPAIIRLLDNSQPVFVAAGSDYRLRQLVVDVLGRLPMHEVMRGYAVPVVEACLRTVRSDNEENALACLKIVLEYNRSFRSILDPCLAVWEKVMIEMLVNFPTIVDEMFGEAAVPTPADPLAEMLEPATPASAGRGRTKSGAVGGPDTTELPRGMKSFKVLHEVPVSVVHILQTHRDQADDVIKRFEPAVSAALRSEPPPQTQCQVAAAAQGKGPFTGVAPAIIGAGKRAQFGDFLVAQVKILAFLAYVLRSKNVSPVTVKDIPPAILRLLKGLPAELASTRRELISAIRHVMTGEARPAFLEHLDDFLNVHVWLGPGICTEGIRAGTFSSIADLVHHSRSDLSVRQLRGVVMYFTAAFHDPTISISLHVLISKLFVNIVEVLPHMHDPEAAGLWSWLMETFVDKLEALAAVREHWPPGSAKRDGRLKAEAAKRETQAQAEKAKSGGALGDGDIVLKDSEAIQEHDKKEEEVAVEKAKIIGGVPLILGQNPEQAAVELKFLIRNVLSGLATMINAKSVFSPGDPILFGRLWAAGIRCITIYDVRREHREVREVLEYFSVIFLSLDLLVFVEAVEPNMEVFLEEAGVNIELVGLAQLFLTNPAVSRTFCGVLLRSLVRRVPTLSLDKHVTVILKLFKMCFMAVTVFSDNESILQPYVGSLIMDALHLATQVAEPMSYYVLLRALFRSVGGGRFEALYKEVFPLLQSIFEELNRLLSAAPEARDRELFAELCLTVPVRLSVLIPHLHYLMRPLVTALRGPPELIGQALRTLELCVDNLTAECLNPIMAPVIHDVMEGLWAVLRPLPYNHNLAHPTVRILGKLGGRNRKQLGPSSLSWREPTEECAMLVQLNGDERAITLAPMVELAARMMKRADQHYRANGFEVLKRAAPLLLSNEQFSGERQDTFNTLIRGLSIASRSDDLGQEATQILLDLADYVFSAELWCDTKGLERPRSGTAVSHALMEALLDNIAVADTDGVVTAVQVASGILKALLKKVAAQTPPHPGFVAETLKHLCSKACSACYEHALQRKIAGCAILGLFISDLDMGVSWLRDRELEIVRALLFAHKDSSGLPATKLADPKNTLLKILSTCETIPEDGPRPEKAEREKLDYLIGLLVIEVQSQTTVIRALARECLQTLSDCSKRSLGELVAGHRDRFNGIFSKPLRALVFPLQIGHLDALTYAMNLKPPLYEWTDNLMRILSEALGIADADDAALLGRSHQVKDATSLIQLRVVCVRFLATALASIDFKNSQIRGRILAAYFKLLYAKAPEVVDAAHLSLKELLSTQDGRLPKDLLQGGLRPVLMNLSDHKRLTVASLQGLARLLEILTNYFKVEIGSKLLDHFCSLSDPEALRAASLGPETENGELKVMAAIVNVFRLLPNPQAQAFLRDLVDGVVRVETMLSKVTASIFTKPLAQYLDQYPVAATEYFLERIGDAKYNSILLAVLASEHSPRLREHLRNSAAAWLHNTLAAGNMTAALHGSRILRQLAREDPRWIAGAESVVEYVGMRWVSQDRKARLATMSDDHLAQTQEDRVMLDVMMLCVKTEPAAHIDLMFHAADIFTHGSPIDYTNVTRFLFRAIITSADLDFKRKVLARFMKVTSNPAVSLAQKAAIMRYLINPLLVVAYRRGGREMGIVEADFLAKFQESVWLPLAERKMATTEDFELEVIQLTTTLVVNRLPVINNYRKEIVKVGLQTGMKNRLADGVVKTAATLLLARFLENYDAPHQVLLSLFTGVLKYQATEVRDAANEALDAIIVACPKQLKTLDWVNAIRNRLIEDGTNLAALHNLYSAIVRRSDVFYPYREQLIPALLSGMPRLALLNSNNSDFRSLTVDMAEVMVSWEERRGESVGLDNIAGGEGGRRSTTLDVDRPSPKRLRLDRSGSAVPSVADSERSYVMPHAYRDQIVTVLVRLVTATQEANEKSPIIPKTLKLLRRIMVKVWPETEIKLAWFERTVAALDDSRVVAICNTFEVMGHWLSNKSDAWILENLVVLRELVEKGLALESGTVHRSQEPVIERLFAAISAVPDESSHSQVRIFEEWAESTIAAGLEGLQPNRRVLSAALSLVELWGKAKPTKVEKFVPNIVKVFQRAVREHIVASGDRADTVVVEATRRQIERLCNILRPHLVAMAEHRRWLLQGLVQLVEATQSTELCRYILDLQRRWIVEKDVMPTIKEKASMLIKMMSFDSRPEDLFRDYLLLILEIYTDPGYARSELTVRLEQAFLLGCRCRDPDIRTKFMDVFDRSISAIPFSRLHYILGVQNWEFIADTHWMHQAIDLLLGTIDSGEPQITVAMLPLPAGSKTSFISAAKALKMDGFIQATRRLLYADPALSQQVWVSLFKAVWSTFTKREQADLSRYLVGLFTKDYLLKGSERRLNVAQVLLEGVRAASPRPLLPPHIIRYVGKTYGAWHTALELLEDMYDDPHEDEAIRETIGDALAQMYAELGEDDLFYGHWRRRTVSAETSAALSYEQVGEWEAAEKAYETAQAKGRANVLKFGRSEYHIWEDHWVLCAEKMQQWDFLSDLAQAEGNSELLLESLWRTHDWVNDREIAQRALDNLPVTASPRRAGFEAYLALLRGYGAPNVEERRAEFTRICDEGIQLALKRWFQLPKVVDGAHISLLQAFQHFVELQETSQIFTSLQGTNQQNHDVKSLELKAVLQIWRERLPNPWDDINIWSDLVAWRQNVFTSINKAYLPLIPMAQTGQTGNANSYAYRGYHETAWIINRFAHIARKHRLSEVCSSALTKIYTLPNIEIQEAFLKLREQAKCHYHNPAELGQGLDVINNTNLMYFGNNQKAEFFTMKGMFLARLNLHDEASQVFNQAVGIDMQFSKAWAEWGLYQDRQFEKAPTNLNLAANAVNCYLQAASLYRNGKARKLLVRILWLLGLDDNQGTIHKALDTFKGDIPVWQWTFFIPQLLSCLGNGREANFAKIILLKIAKSYPQALFYTARTNRDEMLMMKKVLDRQVAQQQQQSMAAHGESSASTPAGQSSNGAPNPPQGTRIRALDFLNEITSHAKTQCPLLTLSMEMLVDQLFQRFKPSPEEDVYRLVQALLADALSQYITRAADPDDDLSLNEVTKTNVAKMSDNLKRMPLQPTFYTDFVEKNPILPIYIQRLQHWRRDYEKRLDRKCGTFSLENNSHYLIEFQYQKFDEVEVPGQYLKRHNEDGNRHFVKIARFVSKFEVVRVRDYCNRRITIIGNDGTSHSFMIQTPVPRPSRREEKIMQLFRMLDSSLSRKKDTRQRNASFNVPVAVPLATNIRLFEDTASNCSLQDVWDKYAAEAGFGKDDPIIAYSDRLRKLRLQGTDNTDLVATKLEIAEEVQIKFIPHTILKNHLAKSLPSATDLWYLRKKMSTQMAGFIFMTYILSINSRCLHRIHIDRSSGMIFTTDMLPSMHTAKVEFYNPEPVPFRLTPNIHAMLMRQNVDGILTGTLVAIGRALTEHDHDLEHRLSIFLRDEVTNWFLSHSQKIYDDVTIPNGVAANTATIIKRAKLLACEIDRAHMNTQPISPACQTVTELLNQATSLPRLFSADPIWMPAF